jgi:hypothetical protein
MVVLNTILTATNINNHPSYEIIISATGTSDVIVIKDAQVEKITSGMVY